ncbi:MAG: hypothetical protein HDR18_00745 [Lachnospiraceae bacterium]|nr:hypothetical protein [Lachnospiraceae bacterium]
MAQYDGSIRINTKIDTSGIKKDIKQLEKELKDLADAQKSFLEAGGTKASPVYKDYEKSIKSAQLALESLKKTEEKQIDVPSDKKDEHYNQLKIDVEEYAKSLKELQDQGKFFGDEDYDKIYLAWKNATDAVKAYQAELNKQTESGQAKIAEQEAKAAERREAAQRKAEEQAERALQKENARIQKEAEAEARAQAAEAKRQAIIEAEAAEEQRLAQIRENAVVGNQRIIRTVERIKQLEQEIADLKAVERTEGYVDYDSRIRELSALKQEVKDYNGSIGRVKEDYKKLGDIAKKALDSIGKVLKKANSYVNSFGKRIKEIAQKHFPLFRKETEKTKSSLSGFGARLKNLALSLMIFNQISKLIRSATGGIKEGFENLYNENGKFKNSIENVRASLLTLKNALAGAFKPIVDVAIPYIQKLIGWLTEAVNLIGQLIAALTGRKTYTKAIKQSAAAAEDAAEATEDETKAINKQLSPLDDLNNLTSENAKEKENSADAGIGAGTMFEEVPIDNSILDMAEKIKDVLSKLFAPLKEAWEREGKFVMNSWKYALDEVWKLIKDIGRDFLTVWQQEATIKIFEDLLHIIGDIGLVVGHLARNFRDAWNENQTGLRILENIRDIIGAIVHNIRLAADQTVEWADKLNFKPILETFERFTKSLIPLADALSGVLSDFYTKVLLPLAKWTIEKGLPELLDVFTAFNEKVDWQALRDNLAEFWEHLEPFAETIGEGLIIFIERVSDALADFLNSQEFKDFLVMLENWMDSVSPEDVADALEMIAKGLIALKVALLGFSAISAIAGIFTTITTFLSGISAIGEIVVRSASLIASGIKAIISAIGSLVSALGGMVATITTVLGVVAAAIVGWNVGSWIAEKLDLDPQPFNETMRGIKDSFTDGTWKEALNLWGEDIKAAWTEIWGYVKEDFENSILGGVLVSFTDGTWKEAMSLWGNDIYSAFVTLGQRQAEWLNSLKNKWLQTWNNIKAGIFSVIASIKSTVGSVIEWISGKLNSLQGIFSSIKGFFGGSSSGTFGASGRMSVPTTYATNPAFAALQTAEIPRLATGAVIPANREFLAVLGDQKHGTNIEAPVSTIKQAQKESLLEVLSELGLTGGNNSGSGNNVYEFSVDGQVFFRIMEKYAREYKKQNGGKIAFS